MSKGVYMGIGFQKTDSRNVNITGCDTETQTFLENMQRSRIADFDDDGISDRLRIRGRRLVVYKGRHWDRENGLIRFAESGRTIHRFKNRIGIIGLGDVDRDGDIDVIIREVDKRCLATEVTFINTLINSSTAMPDSTALLEIRWDLKGKRNHKKAPSPEPAQNGNKRAKTSQATLPNEQAGREQGRL